MLGKYWQRVKSVTWIIETRLGASEALFIGKKMLVCTGELVVAKWAMWEYAKGKTEGIDLDVLEHWVHLDSFTLNVYFYFKIVH